MSGPYETEREARAAVQHILASPPGTGAWGDGNRQLLEDACRAAGVHLGAWDYRILLWLAGWEPSTCAVIAGLITRAGQRRDSLQEETGQRVMTEAVEAACAAYFRELEERTGQAAAGKLAEIRAVLDAFDWELDDRQLALEHIERIAGGES